MNELEELKKKMEVYQAAHDKLMEPFRRYESSGLKSIIDDILERNKKDD